jgi:hypothetical protein
MTTIGATALYCDLDVRRVRHSCSLQIAPVSGMIAPARCDWTPLWSERHGRSYGLSEGQVQSASVPGQARGWIGNRRFTNCARS